MIGLAAALGFVGLLIWAQIPAREHGSPAPASAPISAGDAAEDGGPAELRYVGAAHVLVAYRGAERASPGVKRTKAEARARADEVLAALRSERFGFGDAVQKYSDDEATLPSHGDLGNFERAAMDPSFSEAAFALEVGQVSKVVETPRGFHVIRRTR